MKFLYNYIFYHFYDLGLKIKNRQARESAILYISLLVALPTAPFIMAILYSLFGKIPFILMTIVVLSYAFFIVKLNRKYFENKNRIGEFRNQFKSQSRFQRKMGYVIVITLLLLSFGLFWFFLLLM